MKKLLLILLVCVLSVSVQAQEKSKTVVFGGINYDETVVLSAGVAIPLMGDLYEFTYTNIGEYGSLSAEIGYMFDFGSFYLAPLAGPTIDWMEPEEEMPMLAYIVGSSGLVFCKDFSDTFGLWGYGKYKFKFVDETMYQEGYVFGVGLFIKI